MSRQGYVCLLLIHLHFPEAASLKDKRAQLRPVRQRLIEIGSSVSEVDHHDLRQRATLLASLTAGELRRLHELSDAVVGWLDGHLAAGVVVQRSFASSEELFEADTLTGPPTFADH